MEEWYIDVKTGTSIPVTRGTMDGEVLVMRDGI